MHLKIASVVDIEQSDQAVSSVNDSKPLPSPPISWWALFDNKRIDITSVSELQEGASMASEINGIPRRGPKG